MTNELGLKLLFEVTRVLKDAGLPYCIVEGTLLGILRQNGFIPWDDDIDIGIRHEDLLPKIGYLAQIFISCGYLVSALSFPYRYPRELKLKKAGITIDLINYDQGNLFNQPVRFNVIHDQYASSYHAMDLFLVYKPYKFKGLDILLPRDPERYLIETYGWDWRIPKQPDNYTRYPVIPGWFEDQNTNEMDIDAITIWRNTHERNGSQKNS